MSLKKSVVIVSKFGTKTAGNYILRYTSRDDATESLDIGEYITKYTTRYSATEQLKYKAPSGNEVWAKDEALSRKDGILFGNRGLSYTDDTLREAARATQKASDEGHVAILPIISFDHDYLLENGLVPKDMPKPTTRGEYMGQVDQLKLRQGISDMMDKMHQDMGFTEPEWTGTVQFDTKNVHVHLTTIEKGEPDKKRMKRVKETFDVEVPDMKWSSDDKVSDYESSVDNRGFVEYRRGDDVVARQTETKNGQPKWYTVKEKTERDVLVERGMLNEKTKDRMRATLERSLKKTRDIKPFVKDITDKRQLTRGLTVKTLAYNDVTVEKMQALQVALPENKKMWRANSRAKAMERPHEIANEIVDDMWTRYSEGTRLNDFDSAVRDYITARDMDENLSDEKKDEFYQNAYQRLRTETINELYRSAGKIKEKERVIEIPKQSIKAASTDVLKNEIADSFTRPKTSYDDLIGFEYRQRSYGERHRESAHEAGRYAKNIREYDIQDKQNLTTPESKVVRDHYRSEYNYHRGVADKYAYLRHGEQASGVSKERFKAVRGVDLVNMLYDYGKDADRSVPKHIAQQYSAQTKEREENMKESMRYLITTGQFKEYELMKDKRDAVHEETMIAMRIESELKLPTPGRVSGASLEKRKTIDTVKGRRLLREQLLDIERRTGVVTEEYTANTDTEKIKDTPAYRPKVDNRDVDWTSVRRTDHYSEVHGNERMNWVQQRIQFDAFMREMKRKEREREVEAELAAQYERDKSKAEALGVEMRTKEMESSEKERKRAIEQSGFTIAE